MRKTASAGFGAMVALLATILYEQVFTEALEWPRTAALAGATTVGVVFLVVYELIGGSRAIARRFSPMSKIEGAWKIKVTNIPERPESVCKICVSEQKYMYKGYAIASDGTLGAEWSSRDVHYDSEKEELSFTGDATILTSGRIIRNYGFIKFFKNAGGKYESGNGHFVDTAEELTQGHMTLSRITEQEFDNIWNEVISKTDEQAEKQVISADGRTAFFDRVEPFPKEREIYRASGEAEANGPSVLAISVIIGGIVMGITSALPGGLSGSAGFLVGLAVTFLAISGIVVFARRRTYEPKGYDTEATTQPVLPGKGGRRFP